MRWVFDWQYQLASRVREGLIIALGYLSELKEIDKDKWGPMYDDLKKFTNSFMEKYYDIERRLETGNFDGIVIDEEKAKESPCIKIDGTNLVFSKGIVGALSEEQRKKYCPITKTVYPKDGKICIDINEELPEK